MIQNATNTVMLEPGESNTNSIGNIINSVAKLPPRNEIAAIAKKCEEKVGRGSCSALDDIEFSSNCGVCVKGGTRSTDNVEGRFAGGLYVSRDDVKNATVNKIEIQPTAGACPPGFFFINRKKCEESVNRLDCEEAGMNGGWLGTKGGMVEEKCAQCAPGDSYVYDPKNRSFSFAIRAKSPFGTGRCIIKLFSLKSDGGRDKQIGGGVTTDTNISVLTI